MIELKNLRKEYEEITPITDLSTVIKKGDVISVIGPSGTGKSTLLRMINMLEKPTAGHIIFDGEDITEPRCRLNLVRQKIGMVFQSFNLYNHMSVIENVIDSPLHVKHIDKAEAIKKGMELLEMVGMAAFANAYPNSLSGGQKQRVAIARTLAMEPEIILFDEPTSALDPTMVCEVETVIANLAEQGYTMMLVTHDMDFAESVANRVFFLAEGGIYEEGTPEEIFGNPKKQKTIEFVMRRKMLTCRINKPSYDYISFKSLVEQFIYKNSMPGRLAENLRAICEEGVAGIIIPIMKETKYDRQEFNIEISYSAPDELSRVFVSWHDGVNDGVLDRYTLPYSLIKHYAAEINDLNDKSMEVIIREK